MKSVHKYTCQSTRGRLKLDERLHFRPPRAAVFNRRQHVDRVERSRSWRQVHRMFYEACRCGRTNVVQAKIMYYAVYHFGPRWRLVGRSLRDETPAQPTPKEVRAIVRWFETHDVDADTIPEQRVRK